jgi:hypothetical protein
VGITIRYLAPAAAGTTFTYSVERYADKKFFDFGLNTFRTLAEIPKQDATRPLIYHSDSLDGHAEFDHEPDAVYIIRVYRVGQNNQVIVELPAIMCRHDSVMATGEGQDMEPYYRSGKKFFDGRVIEAIYRLTFHGDDGFTVHTATLWEDGTSSCNCPRWIKLSRGKKERECPHSLRALTLTASIDETGEQPKKPLTGSSQGISASRQRSRVVDT